MRLGTPRLIWIATVAFLLVFVAVWTSQLTVSRTLTDIGVSELKGAMPDLDVVHEGDFDTEVSPMRPVNLSREVLLREWDSELLRDADEPGSPSQQQ